VKVCKLVAHCAFNPVGAGKTWLLALLPWLLAFTVTTTSAVEESCPSLTVTLSVYVPAAENEACVLEEFGLTKETPVPLSTLQVYVNGEGNPSSVAVAVSVAVAGSVIVWFAPALTTGDEFTVCDGFSVTCTSFEDALSCPLVITARTI
jgi:hypothetical protein